MDFGLYGQKRMARLGLTHKNYIHREVPTNHFALLDFVTESFHTKTFCSRLPWKKGKMPFYVKYGHFAFLRSPPLGI